MSRAKTQRSPRFEGVVDMVFFAFLASWRESIWLRPKAAGLFVVPCSCKSLQIKGLCIEW